MTRHVARFPPSPAPTNKNRGGSQSQDTNASGRSSTPGSQSQDSVTTEAILSKLTKAKEIETSLDVIAADLKANPKRKLSPASDEKAQALRLQLCSVLSDVVLLDCMLADSSDAVGRLWKICFYNRINELRSRIAKEKSRAKKRQASGAGSEADAAKKMVVDVEKELKKFLQEAIQLYKYLIERYVKELMPLSQSQMSSPGELTQQQEDERSFVVISSLYRMHIHLGDLYRYSASYNEAEKCYLQAAKLAPGTGNPFNQLAVVAQQSQDALSAVALYYYARSLMATRSPFETSRPNLERLFESNRKWMNEHSRDDNTHARGIVSVANVAGKGGKPPKKAQGEWHRKERIAANRQALARMVDLQWAFYRGVSLDGADDKVDLDGLKKKMSSLDETLTNLIGNASLGESLLFKLISILAFSTLGASNKGKLMNAESGFNAKRNKHPGWNEGIVMTNQALAFSFFLRFCTILAKDAEACSAKKKRGRIHSLSPLLLGFRFVTSIYEGSEWFHGLPFFPSSNGAAGNGLDISTIHELCKESHVEFWKSIASLANHFDTLPQNKRDDAQEELIDLTDVKDFDEFHGYVPFASYLDKSFTFRKKAKYVTVDDAISALAETKQTGSKAGDAETKLKISLFLSIADGNTFDVDSDKDGQFFLSKNRETNDREFVSVNAEDEAKEVSKEQASPDESVPDHSPSFTDLDMDNNTTDTKDVVPLKMSFSEKGMPLLTPAALLAGGADQLPMNMALNNEAKNPPPPLLAPIDSILALSNTGPRPNLDTAALKGVDSILSNFQAKQPEPTKAPLLPPPGFSIQPQQELPQLPIALPLAPSTGISLADFAAPTQVDPSLAFGTNQATRGMMPQAGPSYSTPNMFETMNPFVQAPQPSFNNNFTAANFSGLNQPPGLLNPAQGVNVHQPPNRGLDPTLDFLLNSNNRIQSPDELASSNALNLMVPSAAEPDDQSESILNFLFDSNDTTRARQPLYASQQYPSQTQLGMPQTKNPFAT
mmetsp:Transcript_22021/g.47871  ORF Transcript_22021/g.47871 Transcript_22021/m.47871 type:complete len:1002 (+) Transcript_22021:272-3277(+)|eukprot:CAMPEP_0172313494 /NCGR_PEP_ID=MMETSP1058-20130122/20305_1 /TAXON_ID=83371 /ORGANISM="Detonula confervacea, Strain CCMP 353" /LENGTH=1001 /DNA_ID=CAMNT_0013027151 /DNA_START=231 /DNA_END=3236 /DNA_ORIENTATION=+